MIEKNEPTLEPQIIKTDFYQGWFLILLGGVIICLIGLGFNLQYNSLKKQQHKPSIECIEGYQFIKHYKTYTQVLDSNGNGIKCK